jgi:hypothetical protein
MTSNLEDAMGQLRARTREIAKDSLTKVAIDARKTIQDGYAALDVLYREDGSMLSSIAPQQVSENILIELGDETALIYINGEVENKEARKQYAFGTGSDTHRNPFLAALARLRKQEVIDEISGL